MSEAVSLCTFYEETYEPKRRRMAAGVQAVGCTKCPRLHSIGIRGLGKVVTGSRALSYI